MRIIAVEASQARKVDVIRTSGPTSHLLIQLWQCGNLAWANATTTNELGTQKPVRRALLNTEGPTSQCFDMHASQHLCNVSSMVLQKFCGLPCSGEVAGTGAISEIVADRLGTRESWQSCCLIG
jgi:hypothetical protein